jgi:hypothetical protein
MFRRALAQQRHYLAQNVVAEAPVLNRLYDADIITDYQRETISLIGNSYDRANSLLDILRACSDDKFDVFCKILEDEGQKNVARELRENVSKSGQTTAAENIQLTTSLGVRPFVEPSQPTSETNDARQCDHLLKTCVPQSIVVCSPHLSDSIRGTTQENIIRQ